MQCMRDFSPLSPSFPAVTRGRRSWLLFLWSGSDWSKVRTMGNIIDVHCYCTTFTVEVLFMLSDSSSAFGAVFQFSVNLLTNCEFRALKLSNEFRASQGLPPLEWSSLLFKIGCSHSKGRHCISRMRALYFFPLSRHMCAQKQIYFPYSLRFSSTSWTQIWVTAKCRSDTTDFTGESANFQRERVRPRRTWRWARALPTVERCGGVHWCKGGGEGVEALLIALTFMSERMEPPRQ